MSATPPRPWAPRACRNSPPPTTFAIHTHGSQSPSCAVAEFTRRQAHLVVGLAGDPRSAQAARRDVRDAGGERPLHLFRRLRLLRPQRPRGRGRRRGDAGQGRRPAGAGAVVARRRARLGSEGPAHADRPARGARRLRHRHGLGIGILHPAADRQELHGAAYPGDARGPAGETRHRAGQHLPELQHPLQVRQHQSGVPPARDHAVPAVLDQDAGPHAEHLRQRVLRRRARRSGEGRPDRLPPEISRSRRQARHRDAQPRGRARQVAEAAVAAA